MGRYLNPPTAAMGDMTGIAPIANGGTQGSNPETAALGLNVISLNRKGTSLGVVPLGNDGKIPLSLMPKSSVKHSTLRGPTEVAVNQSVTYEITNFDTKSSYNISCSAGTVSRSGNVITFNAPVTAQNVTLTIGNRIVTIPVVTVRPVRPVVSAVSFGSGSNAQLVLSSSAFAMLSGSATHTSTDWEVSLTSDFSTTVFSSLNNTTNRTAITVNALQFNTQYFVRARYTNDSAQVSNWSEVYPVKTKSSYSLTNEIAKLIPFDSQASDSYGSCVALSSDASRLAVGSFAADVNSVPNTGAVYIYTRFGLGWQLEAKLVATDRAINDQFGQSVAFNADASRIVIGSAEANIGAIVNAGAAYVFLRSGTTWIQEAKLTAPTALTDAGFGGDVSMSSDGTRVAIGAQSYSATVMGTVFVFLRSGISWGLEATVQASDGTLTSKFGFAVQLNADATRMVVGSPLADTATADTGATYVYSRAGSVWTQEAKLLSTGIAANDQFGSSVCINSDATRIVIGSPRRDASGVSDSGAAYVFLRTGTTWAQEFELTASVKFQNDYLGSSVSISSDGSRVAIGAHFAEVSGLQDLGAVYLYTRTGSIWTQDARLVPASGAEGDFFGKSVSLNSDATFLAVGSTQVDTSSANNTGAAYVFIS